MVHMKISFFCKLKLNKSKVNINIKYLQTQNNTLNINVIVFLILQSMKSINIEIGKYCNEINIVDFEDYFSIKIIIDMSVKNKEKIK